MVIVDGSHLLHRCRYHASETDWKEYCRTFCNLFLAILRTLGEKQAVICWNFRGSRKKRFADTIEDSNVRQEYLLARSWLHDSLPRLGFCSLLVEGIETGEIAYWLINSKLAELTRGVNYLISADKNWIQLINRRWHIYNPLIGETVTYIDFCRKHISKPYYNIRRALLGSYTTQKCYGINENNVDRHVEKLIAGMDLVDSQTESAHLNDFVADGQLTLNLELLDLGLLARGERRRLHLKYEECCARVKQPSLMDWVESACQINAPSLLIFGQS